MGCVLCSEPEQRQVREQSDTSTASVSAAAAVVDKEQRHTDKVQVHF